METTTARLSASRYDFCAILYSGGTVRVRVLSMRCGLLTRSYGYYGFVTYGYRFAFVFATVFYLWVSEASEYRIMRYSFEASACLG